MTRLLAGVLVCSIASTGAAYAFPFIDPSNQDSVGTMTGTGAGAPLGTELPATDTKGLKNQLRLTNPLPPGNRSGWTITPRLSIQEIISDNAYEVTAPRRFDATTILAPGISILADTSRLNLNLDYSPNLVLHAVNGPLNALTQQLTLTGLVTVAPDLAFIDLRAVSGVQSRLTGLSGTGTIGAAGTTGTALAPASTYGGVGLGTGLGLNKQNEVQTSSFGISPYLLRQIGDYGTGKLGVSLDASHYSSLNGFAASPFPGGGSNGQSLVTTEEVASFTTGPFLGKFQGIFSADLSQSTNRTEALTVINGSTPTPTLTTLPANRFSSDRQTYQAQLNYALNRTFTFLGMIGAQSIHYGQSAAAPINGLIWEIGVTVTPDPDSALTVKYGHLNGQDTLTASARYALSGRTVITADYSNAVGTQLEHLQNQLNNSVVNINGQLVNVQNGGNGFLATNGLGVGTGVFRFNTLNASLLTTGLRDTVQASLSWSIQTSISPGSTFASLFQDPATGQIFIVNQPVSGSGQATDFKTIGVTWTHELTPDLTALSSLSYTFVHRNRGLGNDSSIATALALQYALSESTSLSARYSFFDRVSHLPGYSLYENLLILGFTKKF